MNDICIKIEHLSKSFTILKKNNTALQVLKSTIKHESLTRTLRILDGLSCEIKKGEKIALLGRNGCGKTTFLRILTGIYEKNSGLVQVNGVVRVLFKSSFGLNVHISVLDNIYLLGAIHGIERNILKNKIEEILATAGLSSLRYSMIKRLSTGQTQRLVLSIFFHAEGDLIILDEAFESVDPDFTQKSDDYFARLAFSNKTMIMTSHQTTLLKKYCSKAIWLDNGKIRGYGEFDRINSEYEQSFLK